MWEDQLFWLLAANLDVSSTGIAFSRRSCSADELALFYASLYLCFGGTCHGSRCFLAV